MARFVRAFPLRHRGTERQGLQRTAPPPPSSVHVARPRKAVMAASTNAVLMGLSMSASVNRHGPPPPETPGEVVGPVFVTSDSAGTLLLEGRIAAPYKQNRWTVYQTDTGLADPSRFVPGGMQPGLMLRFSMMEGRASRVTITPPVVVVGVRTNPHQVVMGTPPPTPLARAVRWTGTATDSERLVGWLPVVGDSPPLPKARVARWTGTATDSERLVGWRPVVGDAPPLPKAQTLRWRGAKPHEPQVQESRLVVGESAPVPASRVERWTGAPEAAGVTVRRAEWLPVVGTAPPLPVARTVRWEPVAVVGRGLVVNQFVVGGTPPGLLLHHGLLQGWSRLRGPGHPGTPVVAGRLPASRQVVGTAPPLPQDRIVRWGFNAVGVVNVGVVGGRLIGGGPQPGELLLNGALAGGVSRPTFRHPVVVVVDNKSVHPRVVLGVMPPLPAGWLVRTEAQATGLGSGFADGRVVSGFGPIPLGWVRVQNPRHLTQVLPENKTIAHRVIQGTMPTPEARQIRWGFNAVGVVNVGVVGGRLIGGGPQPGALLLDGTLAGWIHRIEGYGPPPAGPTFRIELPRQVFGTAPPLPRGREVRVLLHHSGLGSGFAEGRLVQGEQPLPAGGGVFTRLLSHLTQVAVENKTHAHRLVQGTVPLPEHMVVRGVFSHLTQVDVENKTIAHRVILGTMPLPEHMIERGIFIHSGLATDYVAGRVVVGDAPPLPKHMVTRGAFTHLTQVLPENRTIEHRVLLATMPLPGDMVVRGTFHYPIPVGGRIVTPRQVFGDAPPLPEGWTSRRPRVIVLGATAISRVLFVDDESGNTYFVVDESGQTYLVTDESL